ncbi:putative sodium-coupled neutral amino acid transporter 10 [Aphis craccivora]|uniref:Putative sodium-coupled neutral amino acid transporter 10 n=1 Tax=Aphis craccivora TaxID=307492 RepID=A0A6G0YJ30_APHCR|nr:putative sodium-coupled neutral amino acid transporter 10 [Aphis craccivora]
MRAHVMTLANSIIGVSILAMPFCYKECGIILSTLLLVLSNLMSRASCHFLLKSAIKSRTRDFEFLAFHLFGKLGKVTVELSIIMFLMGTCIAFFVVMGDLGPQIIGDMFNIKNTTTLRPSIMIGLAAFVVLPLGLLRDVNSLNTICTAAIIFYACLVFKIFIEAFDKLFSSIWVSEIYFWKPVGLFQCLPIFSMSLFCQTQLFDIFETITNESLDKLNAIIRSSMNMCTSVYISVGILGYIAYYDSALTVCNRKSGFSDHKQLLLFFLNVFDFPQKLHDHLIVPLDFFIVRHVTVFPGISIVSQPLQIFLFISGSTLITRFPTYLKQFYLLEILVRFNRQYLFCLHQLTIYYLVLSFI